MILNELDIVVRDSVFDPNLSPSDPVRKVHVRKISEDTYYYKVWLYLEGKDLPYIDNVTYVLDETFSDPNRNVSRTPANPNCQLVIWTWGLFTVNIMITDKKGNVYRMDHKLSYQKQLPSDSKEYKYEEEQDVANARPTLVSAS